ncbi:Calx-beta domain-containing protein [Arenimonas sp. MALMAid1274]|uniref:Calx-beta domain-containing protein n=1 Tax=Arenimonas sp. MALMAid1274 TaxID=3411630 RepID=UPI003BA268DB
MKPILPLLLALAAVPAQGAVLMAGDGVVADSSKRTRDVGEQTMHLVRIDRRAIETTAKSGALVLPSTGSEPTRARFTGLEKRADGLSIWTGKVQTRAGEQSVVLTLGDGIAFGLIPQFEGPPLRLETRPEGIWLVEGLDVDPVFDEPGQDFIIPPREPAKAPPAKAREDGKVIPEPVVQVVAVYTPRLVDVMGSNAAVEARLVYLESITNQAYIDSGAEVRIDLLATHLIDYTVNNDNNIALGEIRNPSSLPVKIEVDRVRALYGADLLAMVRNFDRAVQNSCGIAYLLGTNGSAFSTSYGFSVTSDRGFGGDNCGEWTFAHELGHNMGSHHDNETTGGEYGAYVYSRGYRITAGSASFSTIMGYTTGSQVRVGLFSSPNLTCQGVPCGIAEEADNVRSLTNTAPQVAAMVAALPPSSEPTVSVADVTVNEGDTGTTTANFVITLSAPSASPVTIQTTTMSGSAFAPADFVARTVTTLIPAGQTSATIGVQVRGDNLVEQNEVFALNITSASGARVRDGQGVATITNDEPIPDLTIADVTLDEGNAGTTNAVFTVSLSQVSGTPVTFDANSFIYAPGPNAATENSDFTPIALTGLTIPAGSTSTQFTVPILGDTTVEQDESFIVRISNNTASNLLDNRSNVWIDNDDDGVTRPTISISPVTVVEGNAGTSTANFAISLSQPFTSAVSFGAATSNGSAQAGSDYVARSVTSQSIPAGQTSTTFAVTIQGDTAVESDETFTVSLNNLINATAGTLTATGTITNDEAGSLPVLAARDDRVVVRQNAAAFTTNVLANDVFDAARLSGGNLTITTAPAQGTATVQTNGTSGTAADDLISYSPAANFSGEVLVGYRLCEGAGRCVDGILSIIVRPSLDVAIDTPSGAGFMDLPMADLRALPAAEFIAYRLRPPQVFQPSLAVDPTPESPWDQGRAGTHFQTGVIATGTLEWRILADARSLGAGDVDLYLGIDLDGDSQPDANEVRCTAAMSSAAERCEMALGVPAPDTRYWAMLHNRSPSGHQVRLDLFDFPMQEVEVSAVLQSLVATGPGRLPADADFPLRLGWTDYDSVLGDRQLAYIRVKADAATDAGVFPVLLTRSASDMPAVQLNVSQTTVVSMPAGGAQDRVYIDVPNGTSSLTVSTSNNTADIDLYLSFVAAPAGPGVAPAPARNLAVRSATTASGNESITLTAPTLTPGRWYVTPVNKSGGVVQVGMLATVSAGAPVVRSGSYFNPARGGHGLFVYPAGTQRAGLWYTYLQDGSPTWYYLQGPAPGANGLWYATLYRSAWTGSSNKLTAIGKATVTPTSNDAFTFSYTLDGETGVETMAALGRGCPTLSGSALDVSSHWFNSATAGSGYSVQMFPTYEFHASFVYDGRGVPRFLLAERNGFGGAQGALTLEQLKGFCPLCTRTGNPTRTAVGTYTRSFSGGSFANIAVNATFADGLPGTWATNHPVQLLGGAGTSQGCAP